MADFHTTVRHRQDSMVAVSEMLFPLEDEHSYEPEISTFFDPLIKGIDYAISPSVQREISMAMQRIGKAEAAIVDAFINMTPQAFMTFFDALEQSRGIRAADLGYAREYNPATDTEQLFQAEVMVD